MNKHERFNAAIAGKPVDSIPAGFWLHFPEEDWFGERAVNAHLDYYRAVDPDILKLMNEYRYQMDEPIAGVGDWAKWKPLGVKGGYYQGELDLIANVADRMGGEAPLLATIHGVYICAHHGGRRPEITFDDPHILTKHLKENPRAVAPALDAVADTLTELALRSIDAGATAIYYSSIGGEAWRFDAETFETWIKPYELRVLNAVKARGTPIILHVCKANPRLSSYADYPADVVNWAVHSSDFDLQYGRNLFDRTILGGLDDRSATLLSGSAEAIASEVKEVVQAAGRDGFILGADCTLPTNTSLPQLRAAIEAVRGL